MIDKIILASTVSKADDKLEKLILKELILNFLEAKE